MRILFISNYLTHHQTELCSSIAKNEGVYFKFIQTEEMTVERKRMGWEIDVNEYPFFLQLSDIKIGGLKLLLKDADVVIIGDTKVNITSYELRKDVLILLYRERLFKKTQCFQLLRKIRLWFKYEWQYRKLNVAVLCASAYTSEDFRSIRCFADKYYKWGYFPPFYEYDISSLVKKKRSHELMILWVGRMIDWKRCEDIVVVAKNLKMKGIPFHLNIVGDGELMNHIKTSLQENDLLDATSLIGSCEFQKVREYMEEANILAMTSTREEGWGVVVNEAMNSACCVVGSKTAGSVPYLVEHGINGFTYECGNTDKLTMIISELSNKPDMMEVLGESAYNTIKNTWNSNVAAARLLVLIKCLKEQRESPYKSGPCSRA